LRASRVAIVLCLVAALVAGVSGCGNDGDNGDSPFTGTTLTIYSSLPLQGPDAAESLAIIQGEKSALAEAGGKVGDFVVKYVSLDDSTASSDGWDARQSAKNARTAAQDRSTIAYLGDFDAGATAITLPTLNEAGILQITPATTLVGLTREEGADKGEPDKYYPTGKRTFGRVIQPDNVQAEAQIAYQRAEGCTRTYLLHDSAAYGKSLTDLIQLLGPAAGLTPAGNEGIDPKADDFSSRVKDITEDGADCLFFGATSEPAAAKLFTQLHAALPALRLFAPAGLATPAFAGALGAGLERVTYLTSPRLAGRDYPPAGRTFLRQYRARYGEDAGTYGMYGYEAMKVALLAIQKAGTHGNDKQAVIDAFFAIRGRESVLGTYSIDKDGDTTLSDYGAYRVRHGRLAFQRVLSTAGS
jgi:branched-chain amino acid transport system substrate-binding protein